MSMLMASAEESVPTAIGTVGVLVRVSKESICSTTATVGVPVRVRGKLVGPELAAPWGSLSPAEGAMNILGGKRVAREVGAFVCALCGLLTTETIVGVGTGGGEGGEALGVSIASKGTASHNSCEPGATLV